MFGWRRWAAAAAAAASGVVGAITLSSQAIAQVLVPPGSGPVTLSEQGVRFEGTTSGAYSLMNLAGRDRRRRLCLGYGDREPNHVFILSEDVARLSVAVESGGGDTTLLVDGPKGIDCDDNQGRNNRDAAVRDRDWPAGTYRVWVGAFEQGDRIDYRLTVSECAQRQ